MAGTWTALLPALTRASLALLVSGLGVALLLRLCQPRAVWLHQLGWCVVLVSGLLLAPLASVQIAWLPAEPAASNVAAWASVAELDLPDNGAAQPATALAAGETAARNGGWRLLLFWMWGLGAGGMLTAGVALWLLLQRLLCRAQPAAAAYQREADEIGREFGRRHRLPLLTHQRLGPLLCLTWRGYRMVVPQRYWQQLNARQRRAVLRHELAHWRRGDVWKSLLVRLLSVPHWFNPMAWWAARRFEDAAEWGSDEALARRHPEDVAPLAAALLRLAEGGRSAASQFAVGASAAHGSSLCVRLRRLIDGVESTHKDPLMKRTFVMAMLCVAACGALFRFQLVAREPQPAAARGGAADPQWRSEAAALAAKLDISDPRLKKLQAALQTESGLIVLRDRAQTVADRQRQAARATVLTDWLESHFQQIDGKYQLRSDQQAFAKQFLQVTAAVNRDMQIVADVFQQAADRLQPDTDMEQLFHKFLGGDAAPVMIYIQHLHDRMRPNVDMLLKAANGVFVQRGDGKYAIHPGRRDDAQRHWEGAEQGLKAIPLLKQELADWAEEFSDEDEYHKRVVAALKHPMFPAYIAVKTNKGGGSAAERVERFFEQFEKATNETIRGVEIQPEQREQVGEVLQEFEQLSRRAQAIRGPLDQLAASLAEDDPLHEGWKQLVESDMLALSLSGELGDAGGDPAAAVKSVLSQAITESEDGQFELIEERAEAIQKFVNEMSQGYRKLRRQARTLDALADRVADPQIAEALKTNGGRLFVLRAAERRLREVEMTGRRQWVEQHFDTSGPKWTLRDTAEAAVDEFLKAVEAVDKELENDDFQRPAAGRRDDGAGR